MINIVKEYDFGGEFNFNDLPEVIAAAKNEDPDKEKTKQTKQAPTPKTQSKIPKFLQVSQKNPYQFSDSLTERVSYLLTTPPALFLTALRARGAPLLERTAAEDKRAIVEDYNVAFESSRKELPAFLARGAELCDKHGLHDLKQVLLTAKSALEKSELPAHELRVIRSTLSRLPQEHSAKLKKVDSNRTIDRYRILLPVYHALQEHSAVLPVQWVKLKKIVAELEYQLDRKFIAHIKDHFSGSMLHISSGQAFSPLSMGHEIAHLTYDDTTAAVWEDDIPDAPFTGYGLVGSDENYCDGYGQFIATRTILWFFSIFSSARRAQYKFYSKLSPNTTFLPSLPALRRLPVIKYRQYATSLFVRLKYQRSFAEMIAEGSDKMKRIEIFLRLLQERQDFEAKIASPKRLL